MADALIDVPAEAHRLEGATAADILAWASKTVGPKLTFATGFGAEGCVIIDLIAKHRLPIDLFTLDTGVLFPETYELWRTLEARYGIAIRAVTSDHLVEASELWRRDPDR